MLRLGLPGLNAGQMHVRDGSFRGGGQVSGEADVRGQTTSMSISGSRRRVTHG